jgi:hypothetical protein
VEEEGEAAGPRRYLRRKLQQRWSQQGTEHFTYKVLVGLPSFAWDFYCQLYLYVSLFLCLFISVSPLCLSQT